MHLPAHVLGVIILGFVNQIGVSSSHPPNKTTESDSKTQDHLDSRSFFDCASCESMCRSPALHMQLELYLLCHYCLSTTRPH